MKRDWLTLAFGVVLVGLVVGLSLRQNMAVQPPELPSEPKPVAAPAATAEPAPAPAEPPAAPNAPVSGRPKPRIVPAPAPEAPASPNETAVSLQVQSDVPGASVFLDREFMGTTPLTLRNLTVGPKQLNVTATGHEGYSSTVDLIEGPNRVNVEFTKVRLSASVPVVHRHAMGSCQGMLAASAKGLAYDTTNKDDAFTLALGDLDAFEVDYLKKSLRIRRRGGRTWNFTNDNADALFVFHRDVTKARERLGTAR